VCGAGNGSGWASPHRRGSALGVYGLGNIGQSAAVFLGPVLAVSIGMAAVFQLVAALLFVWGFCFAIFARNAPAKAAPKGLGAMLRILVRSRLSWVLSLFYFLTFGGFVAFSIYLPTLLREEYGL